MQQFASLTCMHCLPRVPRAAAAAQAKGRTGEAIGRLCQLAPPTALLLDCDAAGAVVKEREVPTSLLHRGDLLKVGGLVAGWLGGWVGGWVAVVESCAAGNCWGGRGGAA